MTVDYCATPGCTGHLGKFSDCVSEAVADHAAEWADDQTGDTDWSSGHLAMITFDDADTLPVDGDRSVPILAGTYLVWTATTGRVHVDRYPATLRDDAERVFGDYASAYADATRDES